MLRKIGLFGIGIIAVAKEKFEEFTQEMVKKGEMNREEGKMFVFEVLLEKDMQLKKIEKKINQKIRYTIESSGIATKKDIHALEKKLEILEKNITAADRN
jgi:polyhydroxyalkanoate synthesis regulator phasin